MGSAAGADGAAVSRAGALGATGAAAAAAAGASATGAGAAGAGEAFLTGAAAFLAGAFFSSSGNVSVALRTTGASIVELAVLTYSPMLLRWAISGRPKL